ncbi:hypothetical protein JTE90_018151 [Oedothorax gibbosus]|uniref:Reverse transcriptase domain-containing protein n=1 Tax=Oedothorax gibbosus TaxID=931172 RepID=A0AAV6U962_9ARAC|nr:hypothetical protein JTE90_018151 [Oedothorax gibbosus]
MRQNITPNPSTASSVPHSPSPATSPSQLPSSLADQVDGFVDLQHPSTHPPSPPREDDDPLPLDDFIPHLNDLLTSATTLSDSRWSEFEALLDEITARIGEVVNLPPPRDDTVTSQPSTTDAGDHRTIQRLYKRNRRRAIRLITEGEGTRCHLEGNTITKHFQRVFSPSEFDQSIFCQATGRSTVPMDPFSPDEVKARLFKFENSAPGPDRISYSHLKEADPSCTAIAKVLNVCLRAKRIPYQWKTSRTILIHKKGDLDDISNWRPISLCATLYKLLTGCLASRLTTWLSSEGVLSDAQKGFLPFDGTFEHHFLVSREIRRTAVKTSGEELCMAQMDLANAFGSVPHAAIDTALLTAGALASPSTPQSAAPYTSLEPLLASTGPPASSLTTSPWRSFPTTFLPPSSVPQLASNCSRIPRKWRKFSHLPKRSASLALPRQRIDALKSFFFPTLNIAMRTGQFSKEQLHQIDDEVRKFVKVTLNLVGPASAASNHYIYGASDAGCLGLPCLEDEHDVVLVDSAFKLLTSRDPRVRNIAWSDLADQIEARTSTFDSRPDATPGQVEAFLSGSCDPPFHRGRSNISSTWSAARNASRRLAVTWSCPEWGSISATFQENTLQPADRRMLQRSIKTAIRSERALKLHEYPSQGIAMECVANSKWGNQFIRTGENIRFCDWRFIHKARLNLCSLNAQRRSSHHEEIDKSCRRCGHHTENLHHVVSTCRPLLHLRTKRHDAVLDRLIKARRRGFRVMGRNQDVDGSSLRPDLVLTQGDTAILIDVAVPYENRLTAFANTRRDKAANPVSSCPPSVCVPGELPVMKTLILQATPPVASRTRGKTVPCEPPVMPPCASWSPSVVIEIPEPPSDPVPVPGTHAAATPEPRDSSSGLKISPAGPKISTSGLMTSPSSPPLDENWSLVFSRSLSQRATYSRSETPRLPSRSIPSSETEPDPTPSPCDHGADAIPATPSASTSPRSDTMWSPMFRPSQTNPLPSFEDTLGTLLRTPSTVVATVDPSPPETTSPTTPSAQNAAVEPTTLGLPEWDQILCPSQFQDARCSPEAPLLRPADQPFSTLNEDPATTPEGVHPGAPNRSQHIAHSQRNLDL